MAVDIDALIAPLTEDDPAGPDLAYDARRHGIESAFERSGSGDDRDGDAVDWPAIIRQIEAQASETRDIWLPVYLMRAGAEDGRLDSVEDGAALLAGLMENLWESVHPQLDEYGFQGRKGPCESLTKLAEFLNPFRNVVLLEHSRLGRYTSDDFNRFRENGPAEDGYGMFRALLEETSDDDLQAIIDRVSNITASIRRVDAVLVAQADGDTGTNFQPTYDLLEQARKAVASFLRAKPDDAAITDPKDEGKLEIPTSSGGRMSGEINSREDVVRAIDAITAYYARKEPGSPVPFALRRARDWVSLDFLEVLEDIAPGSLDEAKRVLVNGRDSGDSYGGVSSNSDDGWGSSSE